MNLRSRKKTVRKRKKEGNLLLLTFACSIVIGLTFFGVFSYTIYLDSQCEKINKGITLKDQKMYKFQREIQNLKIKLENYYRKDYILARINTHNLKLRTPGDYQVINLSRNMISYNSGRKIAYNN